MVRGDSKGGMSSPYSGESASPYSVGIPSPPTVVADFNRPYEAVHYDGPYIQIQKQPQSKFRFRYKSEMVGTHGQLKAECSDKNKAAFPTVKLSKWKNGPAVIRLMLFTAEENVNQRKRHVHELSGKHCDKETGICEVVVDDKCDFTAQFQNLGIIHIAKRDTREIIMRRKREELLTHARLRKPHCSPEEIRRSITQADYKRIDEEADEEAKSMDLNKVVLRFQAFQYDKDIESYRPITLPVDSDVVYNLKNATTGELKIVRMSACSAPCTGGTEIWLLVEKVRRNNVHVKFFELDNNDREVWAAYGEFSDSDVHHQYAIVFKTPRYRFTNLNTAVKVKVQLERPTDRDTSEPLDFTYMPDSLKRSRMHLETALEDGKRQQYHDPPAKKFNFSSYDSQAIDLSNNKFNGRGQEDSLPTPDILEFLAGELATNGNFNVEVPNESPQHMVPSPVNSIDSSNQGLYSPVHPGSIGTPITEFTMTHRQLQVPSPGQQIPHSPQYSMMSPSDQSVGSPQYLSAGDGGGGVGMAHQFADSQSPQYTNSPSPVMMVPSPSYDTNQLLNQQYLQQHQQQQHQMQPMQMQPQHQQQQQQTQMQKQQQQQLNFQHMVQGLGENLANQQQPVQMQPQQMMAEFELPPCFNVGNLGQEPNVLDMLDVAVGHLDFGPSIMNELTADYGGKKPIDTKKVKKEQPVNSGQDVDELAKMVSGVRIDESSRERSTPHSQMDVAFRVAVNAAECLQAYAATGDISPLLTTHRYLLAVQNNQGDTALHTAVSNKNLDAFNKILKACERIKPIDLLNAQNFARETALHQAVRGSEANMVRRLVAVPGCDVSILDAQGNTPLHIAAELQDHRCLEALLTRPVNGARSAITQAINAYNYNGETPLHMAVTSGNFNNVRMLLNAGAQVHQCEHKRGANPLHLCAMFGNHDIANYLISSTPVTIEASLFDGNTALHLAAQARDAEMCRILIRANADPEAKNFLRRRKKVSESEEEEEEETNKKESDEEEEEDDEDSEEEPDCHTPFDYAADNAEILAILRREFVDEPVVVEQQAVEVEAGTKLPSNTGSGLDSGIDISVTDIQSPEGAGDGEDSAGYLSAGVRRRLASHLSGDTWKHLAQLLDLDYMVPCLVRETSPASLLLQPDNMKGVTVDKLRDCLQALGLKDCVAVLDDA